MRWPKAIAYDFDLLKAVNALTAGSDGTPNHKDALNLLYKFLDVIDSKASALLRFNGIILAVLAVLSRTAGESSAKPYFYLATIIILIISCGLCMFVIQIKWGFLGQGSNPEVGFDATVEFPALRDAVAWRHRCYYLAWCITALCGLALSAMIVWEFAALFGRPSITMHP